MRSQGQKDPSLKKFFGQNLKTAFKEAGLKGVDIAKDLGVAENTVSQWFQGKREPKQEILKIFLEKYGINPVYVLTGEGPPLLPRDERGVISALELRGKKKLPRKRSCCSTSIASLFWSLKISIRPGS